MELAGGLKMEDPAFTAYGANLTPDVETGIGGWSDAEIVTAIREGRRPDGSMIGPIMPIALYSRMSDRDVRAIVAYLRTLKPVRNEVPESVYSFPLRSEEHTSELQSLTLISYAVFFLNKK